MVVVPAVTPVTTPALETVATEVFEEVHGVVASAVAVPVSVDVLPTQALRFPEMDGSGLTVNVADTSHPLVFL